MPYAIVSTEHPVTKDIDYDVCSEAWVDRTNNVYYYPPKNVRSAERSKLAAKNCPPTIDWDKFPIRKIHYENIGKERKQF